jgi:hypothetical protein
MFWKRKTLHRNTLERLEMGSPWGTASSLQPWQFLPVIAQVPIRELDNDCAGWRGQGRRWSGLAWLLDLYRPTNICGTLLDEHWVRRHGGGQRLRK